MTGSSVKVLALMLTQLVQQAETSANRAIEIDPQVKSLLDKAIKDAAEQNIKK